MCVCTCTCPYTCAWTYTCTSTCPFWGLACWVRVEGARQVPGVSSSITAPAAEDIEVKEARVFFPSGIFVKRSQDSSGACRQQVVAAEEVALDMLLASASALCTKAWVDDTHGRVRCKSLSLCSLGTLLALPVCPSGADLVEPLKPDQVPPLVRLSGPLIRPCSRRQTLSKSGGPCCILSMPSHQQRNGENESNS